jgi:hypothetical protein
MEAYLSMNFSYFLSNLFDEKMLEFTGWVEKTLDFDIVSTCNVMGFFKIRGVTTRSEKRSPCANTGRKVF